MQLLLSNDSCNGRSSASTEKQSKRHSVFVSVECWRWQLTLYCPRNFSFLCRLSFTVCTSDKHSLGREHHTYIETGLSNIHVNTAILFQNPWSHCEHIFQIYLPLCNHHPRSSQGADLSGNIWSWVFGGIRWWNLIIQEEHALNGYWMSLSYPFRKGGCSALTACRYRYSTWLKKLLATSPRLQEPTWVSICTTNPNGKDCWFVSCPCWVEIL